MRNLLIIAAVAVTATAAGATPMHRHAPRGDNGSAAVRALNEKSLQQAQAGTTAVGQPAAMSDSGAAMPMANETPAAAPAPSTPQ